MIDYQILKKLALEVLKSTPQLQYNTIEKGVERLVAQNKIFPTKEECLQRKTDYSCYEAGRLNPIDKLNINQIVWDLIVDRILTMGTDTSNPDWPWLRLTKFGQDVANQTIPTYYDPEGYNSTLEAISPKIDSIIKQYAVEGLNCFQHRLYFASAVMFGAAAEKAVLFLLEAIANAENQAQKKRKLKSLLDHPNLPEIFAIIQTTLEQLITKKIMPYSVHQSSTEHLLSLFEMIRVHRNDSVHPAIGQINKTKVFLTIQTLPVAIEVVYRLIGWFNNKI